MLSFFKKALTVLNAVGILIKWWDSYFQKRKDRKEALIEKELSDAKETFKNIQRANSARSDTSHDSELLNKYHKNNK